MSNEELKPCPNCEGKLHVIGEVLEKRNRVILKCDKCETEFIGKNKGLTAVKKNAAQEVIGE